MKSTLPTHSEKRDFIRMRIDTPASVVVKSTADSPSEPSEQTTTKGICRDLSGGGMLLELSSELGLEEVVEVEVSSTYGHKPMLKAKAEVARIEVLRATHGHNDDEYGDASGEASPTYFVGLHILELLED